MGPILLSQRVKSWVPQRVTEFRSLAILARIIHNINTPKEKAQSLHWPPISQWVKKFSASMLDRSPVYGYLGERHNN